jgi:V/A-type H+/Na+-transporting ATPase subunit C
VAKFAPLLVSISSFTYPNAKFNAIGSGYLREKELSNLIGSKNLEDFKNNIANRDFIIKGEKIGEVQESVDESLADIIRMASKDSPGKVGKFYYAYLQKLDARTIKDAVRNVMEGKKVEDAVVFSPNSEEFIGKINEGGKDGLVPALSSFGMDEIRKLVESNATYTEIEYAIDRKIVEDIGNAAVPHSCIHSRDVFVKRLIDVLNLKAILRAKYYRIEGVENMLFGEGRELPSWKLEHMIKIKDIPEIISLLDGTSYIKPLRDVMPAYEKEGISALEIALDRQLIRHAADIALEDTMELGPGIRFIVEKEFEARNLKAIAKGVGEGLPPERIWKLMVIE